MKIIATREGMIQKVNPAFCKFVGLPQEALEAKPLFEGVHPQDKAKVQQQLKALATDPATLHFETQYSRQTGEYCCLHWTAYVDAWQDLLYIEVQDISQQKKKAEEMALLHQAFKLIHSGVFIAKNEPSGQPIIYANSTLSQLTGLQESQIQDMNLVDLFCDLPGQEGQQFIDQALLSRKKVQTTLRNCASQHQDTFVQIGLCPVLDDANQISYLVGFTENVSKNVRDQQKIEHSESLLDLVLRSSPLAIWDWDFETDHIMTWESKGTYCNGNTPEASFALSHWESLVHPDEVLHWRKRIMDHLSGITEQYECEYRIQTHSGAWKWIQDSGKIVEWDKEGQAIRMTGTFWDISKRKKSQAVLLKSFQLISHLNQALNASSIVAKTDKRGIITYVNDKFVEISGYAKEELLGKTHQVVNSHYHSPEFFQDLWTTISSGQIWRGELRNQRKDGSSYWVDTTIVPFFNKGSEPNEYIAIRRDITQQKEGELELQKLNQRLKSRLKDFNQFAHIASHNLRAPVASLLGLVHLLTDKGISKEDLPFWLTSIEKTGNQLDQVIRDINQVLTIRQSPHQVQQKIELAPFLKEVIRSLSNEISPIEARITTDFSAISSLRSVRPFLFNIFLNLLQNALRFRDPYRPLEIHVSTEIVDTRIRINFADNGLGLEAAKYQDRVFQMYQSFHPGISGNGLGLHLVRQQMESLGGRIYLESEVNRGTVIHLDFEQATLQHAKKLKKVFLIDDDPVINMIQKRVIEIVNDQLELEVFTHAEEALKRICSDNPEHHPDLILLDINMPQMDGWQFLEALQELPIQNSRAFDVVMLTSSIFAEDKAKAGNFSIVKDFVSKPLTKENWKKLQEVYA